MRTKTLTGRPCCAIRRACSSAAVGAWTHSTGVSWPNAYRAVVTLPSTLASTSGSCASSLRSGMSSRSDAEIAATPSGSLSPRRAASSATPRRTSMSPGLSAALLPLEQPVPVRAYFAESALLCPLSHDGRGGEPEAEDDRRHHPRPGLEGCAHRDRCLP